MTHNPFSPAVHRYQVGGEDHAAPEITTGPQKLVPTGTVLGGITSVTINSKGTHVSTASDFRSHVTGSSAPSNGVHYTTPYGTPIDAIQAKDTDLVTIHGQTATVRAMKLAGLL
jgi:hypothetical protein